MSGPPAEIEDSGAGEAERLALLSAALRADHADLSTYAKVLMSSLEDALPAGVIEVERDRSLSDRVAGRPGEVRTLRIVLGEETLELHAARSGLVATLARRVRGVAISRRELTLEAWSAALAHALSHFAAESEAARQALERMLGAGGSAGG